ncbi:MAG: GlsB/YeaQ/YmgE family stress response membrane protein [Anaerolineae bacterium]|nr:GlsB/YeaQ/YmgE family stress response membrane protein [Anaerolineae bacterium]
MLLNPTTLQLLVWIVVATVAGMVTSMLLYRKPTPSIDLSILGLGFLGALVGRIVFDLLRVQLNLPALVISMDDVVAALIGSVVVLFIIRYLRR